MIILRLVTLSWLQIKLFHYCLIFSLLGAKFRACSVSERKMVMEQNESKSWPYHELRFNLEKSCELIAFGSVLTYLDLNKSMAWHYDYGLKAVYHYDLLNIPKTIPLYLEAKLVQISDTHSKSTGLYTFF